MCSQNSGGLYAAHGTHSQNMGRVNFRPYLPQSSSPSIRVKNFMNVRAFQALSMTNGHLSHPATVTES